jgi:UDP-glucose 4-epimerase
MHSPLFGSRILVTGGCGFLGRQLVQVLRSRFSVVAFDVRNPGGDEDFHQGSVTESEQIEAALDGVSGLVIAHMAPRQPGIYDSPDIPFAINVDGTAKLLDAAVHKGIKRVVLVSSVAVVQNALAAKVFLSGDLPSSPDSIYGLTKSLQEETARYYHTQHGLEIAILRPAYVCLGDSLEDKYGIQRPSVNWQFIDPRDIGQAALLAFSLENLGCETFYLVAGPDAERKADIAHSMNRLGWTPQYRFAEFPSD